MTTITQSDLAAQLLTLTSQLHRQAQLLNEATNAPRALLDRCAEGHIREPRVLREHIKNAAFEVYNLLLEPEEVLRTYATHAHLLSLHFIQRFNVAKVVPDDKMDGKHGMSIDEIATTSGQKPSTVQRMLRHSIGLGVFQSTRDGRIQHTPASRLLRQDSYAAWMASTCEESWPAATRTVDALERFPAAEEPSQAGWSFAKSSGQSLYDGIAKDKKRASRFAKGMAAYSSGSGYAVNHLVNEKRHFFRGLPTHAVFVDVGGGLGQFSIGLSKEFDHINFVVQDLEGTIARAKKDLENSNLGVSPAEDDRGRTEMDRRLSPSMAVDKVSAPPRLIFMAHDFFEPQPVVGAAVYFLRWILHNWSDKYAVRILKHIAVAMTESSRLIIHDYCINDELGEVPILKRRQMTNMDLGMMQLLNAQERTSREWQTLLARADPRFVWLGVTNPKGSALAIIEAGWQPR